jgi:8-oxo-dGTP pyrophosphatase MutT (NUDIX family)
VVSGWEALAGEGKVLEPVFKVPKGLQPAAGVVIREPDGRIWVVCPTNQFGGHEVTFPKGRLDGKSLQATALCEAFEESGLRVRLIRHLVDVRRTQTYTRYYLAERAGGSPADMGWESQCVMLVPGDLLASLDLAPTDRQVIKALGGSVQPG